MKGLGNISTLLIAGIVTSMVVMGMTSFFVDMASNPSYNLSMSKLEAPISQGGFGNFTAFNQTQEITRRAGEMKNQTEVMTQTLGPAGIIIGVVFGAVQTVMLSISSLGIFQNMVSSAVGILGLPVWLETALFGILIIFIVFTILSAVLNWRV